MFEVRFMSLVGAFRFVKAESFATIREATAAVEAYATQGGYSNVKLVDEEDGFRWTAKTPGGRSGRNVAYTDC